MSSYCLTLMAIAYLQHIGHLPNLQADINVPEVCRPEDTSEHDVVWVSWGKEQGVKAHVGFSLLLLITGNHQYRTSLRLTPSGGSLNFSLSMDQPRCVAKNLIDSLKLFPSSKVVLYPERKSMAKK